MKARYNFLDSDELDDCEMVSCCGPPNDIYILNNRDVIINDVSMGLWLTFSTTSVRRIVVTVIVVININIIIIIIIITTND